MVIEIWDEIINYLIEVKDTETQSYINCLYNKARALSKIVPDNDEILKNNLVLSLKIYTEIKEIIQKIEKKEKILPPEM